MKPPIEPNHPRYVSPSNIAMLYTALGERDQAFAWLNKAYQERDDGMLLLKVSPIWDDLRSDPRFRALVKKVAACGMSRR